jgi:hypothetical protein
MSTWADYAITHKRMNAEGTHIDRVQAHSDLEDRLGSSEEFTRQEVIAKIKKEITFVTVFKNADGNYGEGEKVIIVLIHGVDYIKTLADGIEADNLDQLPDF